MHVVCEIAVGSAMQYAIFTMGVTNKTYHIRTPVVSTDYHVACSKYMPALYDTRLAMLGRQRSEDKPDLAATLFDPACSELPLLLPLLTTHTPLSITGTPPKKPREKKTHFGPGREDPDGGDDGGTAEGCT